MFTYTQHDLGNENSAGKPGTVVGSSQMIGTGEDRGEKNPFDRWITQKLHGVFDAIAQEPLPPELMKLVNDLEEQERQKTTNAQSASFNMPDQSNSGT